MQMKIKNIFWYHLIITIVFTYIFVEFLTLKRTNLIYKIYADYILNKYCLILYILLSFIIMKYDTYTGILLLILIIAPFKISLKEFFEDNPTTTIPTITATSTATSTTTTTTMKPTIKPTMISGIPLIEKDGIIMADIPKPTATFLQDAVNNKKLIDKQFLGVDDRFKSDDVAIKEILRQIKSQIDFDPYKTNLTKETINEIYSKYFDNDVFIKLKNINNDSKNYLAAGNFKYIPTVPQVDYDLTTYQNLSDNTQFGINPIIDGISNKTKINRGK